MGLNVGLQLTRHLKLYAGYSLLWVSTVARAGEQIDPVVNMTQFPIRSGNGPLVGPARPAFHFDGTDFWAQGLNFGLELGTESAACATNRAVRVELSFAVRTSIR